MAYFRMSGGGGSKELHGAIIKVTAVSAELYGKPVSLYYGGTVSATGTIGQDGKCQFKDIMYPGTYTVQCETAIVTATVSEGDILNVNTIEVTIALGILLNVGNTYRFGGYDWTCAEDKGDYYVLQSQGVTSDSWNNLFNSAITDQDGVDCHTRNATLNTLYGNISYAEKTGAEYGSGLFLVSKEKCGYVADAQAGSGNYYSAMIVGANNYAKFSSIAANCYTGSWDYAHSDAYVVARGNTIERGGASTTKRVIAPAFNLDKSKVVLDGDEIISKEQRLTLELGKTYKLGGYDWTCAEDKGGYYVLQSQGVTADTWNNLFNSASTNQDGIDCHDRNTTLNELYGNIESMEYENAEYGSGLFLVSNAKCGTTTRNTKGTGLYADAHDIACRNYGSFGSLSYVSWLGTYGGVYQDSSSGLNVTGAWTITQGKTVFDGQNRSKKYVIAPAFNIDKSKAHLEDDTIVGNAIELVLGQTYQMAGYDWTCAEKIDGGYCLQSQGVTGGYWPGYIMSKFGGSYSYYSSNIDGQDISDYDNTMKTLYSNIKAAEKSGTGYGSGLFLVSKSMAGATSSGTTGSGLYWSALKTAATNHSSFGAWHSYAWLGTVFGSGYAYNVSKDNNINNSDQGSSNFVVAPAFNLDASKVTLSGNTILIN